MRPTLLMLAALVVVLLTPGSAVADAALIGSSPEDRSRVRAAPRVTFEFNQRIDDISVSTAVHGPSGKSAVDGKPTVQDNLVVQRVITDEPGTYTASYRVLSADGHPVTGTITFEVDGTAEMRSNIPSPSPTPTPAASTALPAQAGATNPNRAAWKYLLVGTLVAAAVVFVLRRHRSE